MAEVIEPTLCPEPDYNTYCSEPDSACKDYHVQHTMYRIKDPKVSLEFYTKVLGMRLTASVFTIVNHVLILGC